MKRVIALCMCIIGVCVGLYAGVWLCFIGGIMDIIGQIKAVDASGLAVLWALIKIAIAGPVGVLCAFMLIGPGASILIEEGKLR